MRFNDLVLGIAVTLFAAVGLVMVWRFPAQPGTAFGPGAFPALIFSLMGLCGIVVAGRGYAQRGAPWLVLSGWAAQRINFVTLAVLAASVLFYILAAPRLGFLAAGFLSVFGVLAWAKGRKSLLVSAATAAAATLVIYAVFAHLLRVPLPYGLLEPLLREGEETDQPRKRVREVMRGA